MDDDDALPVIDLTDDELAGDLLAGDLLAGAEHAEAPPLRRARGWGRRAGLVAATFAVAVVATGGGVAWSSSDRRLPTDRAPHAGELADALDCGGGDPHVRNDLGLVDDASPPATGRSLPMPPWLRDRSLSATKIRTAVDAARWSNTNTEAAVAFGTVTLAEWDAATRLQLQRAQDWARAWWSRHGDQAPLTWSEGIVVAAVRDAVLDDRRLTEHAAGSVRGSLTWRVLPQPSGRERADTAIIGGTRRDDDRLVEVLVYRRSADGYLRLQGRTYCAEVDMLRVDGATRGGPELHPAQAPALTCTRTFVQPGPDVAVIVPQHMAHHVDGRELLDVVGSPVEVEVVRDPPGPPGDPSVIDGHTPPRELHRYETTAPALDPEVALDRFTTSGGRPPGTIGGQLSYTVAATGSTRIYATGSHNGQVKHVIELRRELGGVWHATNHSGCYADLAAPAEGPLGAG